LEEIAISKFKATCLAVLERVRKTGKPIRVTRFGQAIAEINPPFSEQPARRFGRHIGSGQILGDIIAPASDISDWEAESDPDRTLDPNRESDSRKRSK
jgi:antitoxin (DNA-binding transcriptional repressor) of toxin-antitoxin stability system